MRHPERVSPQIDADESVVSSELDSGFTSMGRSVCCVSRGAESLRATDQTFVMGSENQPETVLYLPIRLLSDWLTQSGCRYDGADLVRSSELF